MQPRCLRIWESLNYRNLDMKYYAAILYYWKWYNNTTENAYHERLKQNSKLAAYKIAGNISHKNKRW